MLGINSSCGLSDLRNFDFSFNNQITFLMYIHLCVVPVQQRIVFSPGTMLSCRYDGDPRGNPEGKTSTVVRLAARKSLIHRLRANLENNTMYSLITIILASVAHWQSLWYRGAILAWPAGAVVLRKALRTRRS